MYTLRIITETRKSKEYPFEQAIANYELGNVYCVVKKGQHEKFMSMMKKDYAGENKELVKSILCAENGSNYFIEFPSENKRFYYFVMADTGATFERL